MAPKFRRRQFLRATSVGGVLSLAGCLSTGPPISEDEAKNTALQAEKQYLDTNLANQPCGSGSAGTPEVENTATIENETSDGFYVKVIHGYSFVEDVQEGSIHSDSYSEATYLVTENQTKRVNGTDISPCQQ